MTKLRIGVLSTAKIGLRKVIPAMQQGQLTEVTAIASRNLEQAQKAAADLRIPKAYGSYEDLLADPEIDAVYIPLPNDLHVPWATKAARAGKHVLCEKPLGLNAEEARTLLQVESETGKKIAEAFMVKLHPEWIRTRQLIAEGRIGPLRLVTGTFSYFNDDPANIRNKPEHGGGALMDIGCYLVFAARQLFGMNGKPAEPTRVLALIERDPASHIDRLTSFLLDFPAGQAVFTCSTQLVAHQRIQAFGPKGRIEIEIPVNIPPDRPVTIHIDNKGDLYGTGTTAETFEAVDQYTLQGDAFARAIFDNTEVPVSVSAAIRNMAVLDALFRSARTNAWETP
jgi:predicted dehydrogenase